MKRIDTFAASLSTLLLLAGCVAGPDYSKPEVETPAAYKESGDWVLAKPADAVAKGKWWEVFDDPVLNGFVEQVSVSNQTLAAAEARYRQAAATLRSARAGLYPTVGAGAGASRSRRGENATTSTYNLGLDAGWEIDLWGRVRRTIEASTAG